MSEVPQFVIEHAPLLHLSSKDPYNPTPLATTLFHTTPQIAFKAIPTPSPPLTLSNLSQLNGSGENGGSDVYLTSNEDATTSPKWREGVNPNKQGSMGEEKTGAVIVVEKMGGVVDVFYFGFWGWNFGGIVLGKELGNHVGDWEHNMIRFVNGVPKYIWYSQHANGEAFTFSTVHKDASGSRPLSYVANGSHALYPLPGSHDHTIPNFNLPTPLLLVDETDAGPLYDPLLSPWFYTYDAASQRFSAAAQNPNAPTAWLDFQGRWGDEEYADGDKRQDSLFGHKKYVGGPTGPRDKQLDRKEVWPENSWSKGQRIRTSLDGRTGWRDCLGRWGCFGSGKDQGKA